MKLGVILWDKLILYTLRDRREGSGCSRQSIAERIAFKSDTQPACVLSRVGLQGRLAGEKINDTHNAEATPQLV